MGRRKVATSPDQQSMFDDTDYQHQFEGVAQASAIMDIQMSGEYSTGMEHDTYNRKSCVCPDKYLRHGEWRCAECYPTLGTHLRSADWTLLSAHQWRDADKLAHPERYKKMASKKRYVPKS